MSAAWNQVSSPSFSLATGGLVKQLADGSAIIAFTTNTPGTSDTKISLYSTSDAWSAAATIPVGSLGGGFTLNSWSPLVGTKMLVMNSGPSAFTHAVIGSVDLATGAVVGTAPGAPATFTTTLAGGTWDASRSWFWFSNLPGYYAQFYGSLGLTQYLMVFYDIATAALVGLLLVNLNSGEDGIAQLGEGMAGQGISTPQGGIYGIGSGAVPTGTYGDISSVLPSNLFQGGGPTPTTCSITWADGTISTGVPGVLMTQINGPGVLTPTAFDSFHTTLIAQTLGGGGAPAGVASYMQTSFATGFPITVQAYNQAAETFGASGTANCPVDIFTVGATGIAFNGTAYVYAGDDSFWKFSYGAAPPVVGLNFLPCGVI